MITSELKLGWGIECCVYDVGYNLVYKVYPDNCEATIAHKLQCIAFNAGLAPEPFNVYENGYFSEKVVIVLEHLSFPEIVLWMDVKTDLLGKLLRLFNIRTYDDHCGNFGIRADGTLCIIDFGGYGLKHSDIVREFYENNYTFKYR